MEPGDGDDKSGDGGESTLSSARHGAALQHTSVNVPLTASECPSTDAAAATSRTTNDDDDYLYFTEARLYTIYTVSGKQDIEEFR